MIWALLLVVLGACGRGEGVAVSPTTSTTLERRVAGIVTLRDDSSFFRPGQRCVGTGGYRDIAEGAQVTVKYERRELLAVETLGIGTAVPAGESSIGIPRTHCRFGFDVGPLPERPFYSVEVSRRGALSYSRADLEAKEMVRGNDARLIYGSR